MSPFLVGVAASVAGKLPLPVGKVFRALRARLASCVAHLGCVLLLEVCCGFMQCGGIIVSDRRAQMNGQRVSPPRRPRPFSVRDSDPH